MAMVEDNNNYNMQLTLERHLDDLAQRYPVVRDIRSLWTLFRKRLEDELTQSRSTFVNYSLHDGSHSRSVIQAIERFLGEDRIHKLSATDTFMLLACTYAHDYGMAQTFNKIYDILGTDEFDDFLKKVGEQPDKLDKDEKWAVDNLLHYINKEKEYAPLKDIYFSVIMVIQLYLRPNHWKGVEQICQEFEGLFLGQVKKRFIYGTEGIVEICMCHGQSMNEVLRLPKKANGIAGDDYHPRFVAAMLRLGDLLDIDNGRFPVWFVSEIAQNRNIIPKLSVLHFKKHESISHLLIAPDKIEITAQCRSKPIEQMKEENERKKDAEMEKARRECYEVAALVNEWTIWLTEECQQLALHWNEIAQPHFGGPPSNVQASIFVDGYKYMAEDRALQMKMSQERVMRLLEGSSIYLDQYVGIREMLQNAVDASLLQLWSDLTRNRYSSCGLTKNDVLDKTSGFDLLTFLDSKKAAIFENYHIVVEVIKDEIRGKVFIVVKDRGIGITADDVKYIADIGSSKEDNDRICKLMESMPVWLKPSGVFGIGLQSVFQMTDCIEFYTRQHNESERLISLYSYGKNRGKIATRELPESKDELYYDNAVPGTNVKIAVEPDKILETANGGKNKLKYYDPEFDVQKDLEMIFVEICDACVKKLREMPIDYFNVYYEPKIITKNGKIINTSERKCIRRSFIYPDDTFKGYFGKVLRYYADMSEDGYSFNNNKAFFWDRKSSRCYILTVRPCKITSDNDKKRLILPEKVPSLYEVSYKFNIISNADSIYAHGSPFKRLHAGFLNMEILILDDQPTNYMNIDRNRLRNEAIDEDELLKVRSEILKRWCRYFCIPDGKKGSVPQKAYRGSLINSKEILFSLILTFYQNVPEELFNQFMEPYNDLVKELNYLWGEEDISVAELWNPQRTFEVDVPLSNLSASDNIASEEPRHGKVKLKNICCLPHRLVHIRKIKQEGELLRYYLNLKKPDEKIVAIEMDDGARLYDYMQAFDEGSNYPGSVNFQTAMKKVFKPDGKYPDILMPCFPRTFYKGHNMDSDLDYCINGCILSPFDQETLNKLSKKEKTSVKNLTQKAMSSPQLEKCVSYIMKKREAKDGDRESQKDKILQQYEEFVKKFFTLLFDNWDMFCNQYKKGSEIQEIVVE